LLGCTLKTPNVVLDQVGDVFQAGRYTLSSPIDILQLPGLQAVNFYNSGFVDMRHIQALLHTGNNHCLDLRQGLSYQIPGSCHIVYDDSLSKSQATVENCLMPLSQNWQLGQNCSCEAAMQVQRRKLPMVSLLV